MATPYAIVRCRQEALLCRRFDDASFSPAIFRRHSHFLFSSYADGDEAASPPPLFSGAEPAAIFFRFFFLFSLSEYFRRRFSFHEPPRRMNEGHFEYATR